MAPCPAMDFNYMHDPHTVEIIGGQQAPWQEWRDGLHTQVPPSPLYPSDGGLDGRDTSTTWGADFTGQLPTLAHRGGS